KESEYGVSERREESGHAAVRAARHGGEPVPAESPDGAAPAQAKRQDHLDDFINRIAVWLMFVLVSAFLYFQPDLFFGVRLLRPGANRNSRYTKYASALTQVRAVTPTVLQVLK